MKNFSIRFILGTLFFSAAILFTGCKSDEHYDVTGDAVSRVYFSASNKKQTLAVTNTPVGVVSGAITAKIPASCSHSAKNDIKVTLSTDTTLVSAYNTANSTSYGVLPANMVSLSNSVLTILQGQMSSKDSLTVSLPSDISSLTKSAYLIPVKISSVDADNAAISTNYTTVAYIIVNITYKYIKDNVASAAMSGTLLTSYTGWTFTANPTGTTNTYTTIIDGSTSTYWGFGANTTLTVDMASAKSLTGFRIANYTSTSYYFSSIVVAVSNDGTNYTTLGTPTNTTMVNETGYQYVSFYAPLSCRYLRLGLSFSNSSYRRIYEFGVYAQ